MPALEQVELDVEGMTCESCAAHVTKALSGLPGVKEVNVPGWQSGRAQLVVEPETSSDVLTSAVGRAGYRAAVRTRRSLAGAVTTNGSGGHYDLMIIGGGSAPFYRSGEKSNVKGLTHRAA